MAATDLAASARIGGVSRVKMAGIVVSMRERVGKSGRRYAFAEFSDATGSFEVTLFSVITSYSIHYTKLYELFF